MISYSASGLDEDTGKVAGFLKEKIENEKKFISTERRENGVCNT